MSMPICNVTVTILSASGQPVVGAAVVATLSAQEVYQGLIVPARITGVTGAGGSVVLPLWPNAAGSLGTHYRLRATLDGTLVMPSCRIYVPNVASGNAQDMLLSDDAAPIPVTGPVRSLDGRSGVIVTTVSAVTSVDATALVDGQFVYATGRSSVADGGGGMFMFTSSTAAATDGGTVFAPAIGTGRLIREGYTVFGFNGPVRPEWWGAFGSGTDTSALQNMLNRAQSWGQLCAEFSRMHTSGMLSVFANTTLRASNPNAGLKCVAGSDARQLSISGSARKKIVIDGLMIDGNAANVTDTRTAVTFFQASDFELRNCRLWDIKGIAVIVSAVTGYFAINFNDLRRVGGSPDNADGYRKQGIAVSNAVGAISRKFEVIGNRMEDIGLDGISLDSVELGIINGNRGERFGGAMVYTMDGATRLSISYNVGIGHGYDLNVSPPGPNGLDLTTLIDSTVVGNVMTGWGGTGIGIFKGSRRVVVSSNLANDNGWAAAKNWRGGITVGTQAGEDPLADITVVDNQCTDTKDPGSKQQTYGIYLDRVSVSGLVMHGNKTSGNAVADYGSYNPANLTAHSPITDWSAMPSDWQVLLIDRLSGLNTIYSGTGNPNGVVSAPVGSIYMRRDGASGASLYIKESGTGNTGWVGK